MAKNLVTIIIPIYNQQDTIANCMKCLKKQTYGFRNLEIILINDGSQDDTAGKCIFFAKHYRNVQYIEQQNRGVSAARNAGLRVAKGKYIFFLDADDTFSSNTIADCVREFEWNYNQVDLLTYPIETYYKGKMLKPHFRYDYLKENGVYDLRMNAFIGQTTMNIVVKNQFENNVFFDESLSFAEDQKYCCEIVKRTLRMGFCKTAKYIYNRSDESSSGRLSGACFIFETSIKLFEDLFAEYEYVPMAFQGLFVNDIYWKMISNIYFPYHYNLLKYRAAIARVKRLLRKCYNSVILDHPNMDYYEKFYLMRLKGSHTIQTVMRPKQILMFSEGYEVFNRKTIEIVVTKIKVNDYKVIISGFLKSVFFQFYSGSILVNAIENNNSHKILQIAPSTHNYYRSHEPTQCFYRIQYECDVREIQNLKFEIKLKDTILLTTYYFMPLIPINNNVHSYRKDFVQIAFKDNQWKFSCCQKADITKHIWLYYDCKGVERDNGMEQYLHDLEKHDGIERYYVITDEKQQKHLPLYAKRVTFGTEQHKELFFVTEKIITAYIENNNIFPYPESEYKENANKLHFEVVYLQHGVLHIDMPWKYSPEKIIADKVVVSTDVDFNLFRKNGFREEDLWKIKMPRFDMLSRKMVGKRKILIAPSWRSYLVGQNVNNQWTLLERKFLTSNYYEGLKHFFESERLENLLIQNNYVLDVKLHPIFKDYVKNFQMESKVVQIKEDIRQEDYCLFITDFSSFLFDFLYMDIPVLSYIPDFMEFACGMNGYRKVDFMEKVKSSDICKTPDEIIDKIELFMKTGKGMEYKVQFWENSKNSSECIYEMLTATRELN